jgi:hypothetical protein
VQQLKALVPSLLLVTYRRILAALSIAAASLAEYGSRVALAGGVLIANGQVAGLTVN